MDGKGKAIDQLQQIDAELAALLVDLENYGIEPSALGALRSTLHEMHATVRTLRQAIEDSQLSPNDRSFLRSLIADRLRHASQLHVDLSKDVEEGRIRTDQQGLSTYLRVLNQTIDQLEVLFGRRQAQPRSQTLRSQLAPRTVLLVDDEDTLRKMVRDYLEAFGWRVLEAPRGVEAIQVARVHAGKIDLLLTDIEMSGMSGWELAERMVELAPRVHVLYMSGGMSLQEWTDSRQQLARSDFIQKPFGRQELKNLLATIFPLELGSRDLKKAIVGEPEINSLTRIRILIADDYIEWRSQIRLVLQVRPELQVICEVGDGGEAVQKADELKPDVVLLDIGLPTLNGIEAACRIRELSPHSKIIFISANNSLNIVQAGLNTGALGFVYKSHVLRELLPAIDTVLRGEQFIGHSVKS